MNLPYADRAHAGKVLAEELKQYCRRDDVLVLGLVRGGLPVADEVAKALDASLDCIAVRKLGAPRQPELAIGAIAGDQTRVLNDQLISELRVTDEMLDEVTQRERRELQRRRELYRDDRPEPRIEGRCVILVDDGLATGATMRAAASACRAQSPSELIIAAPVAAPQTVQQLRDEADEVICPATPQRFSAVGQWYRDFPQVSDDEVRGLLHRAWQRESQTQSSAKK